MVIGGFDASVAAAHGYHRQTIGGRPYAVKSGAGAADINTAVSTGVATPNTSPLWGPCGMSYVNFSAFGGLKANLDTGFALNYQAVSYSWTVAMADQIGVGTLSWSGLLWFRNTWSAATVTQSGAPGSAVAVVSTSSAAVLSNGGICYSMGPSTATTYY
jgi:hypothetical protein